MNALQLPIVSGHNLCKDDFVMKTRDQLMSSSHCPGLLVALSLHYYSRSSMLDPSWESLFNQSVKNSSDPCPSNIRMRVALTND